MPVRFRFEGDRGLFVRLRIGFGEQAAAAEHRPLVGIGSAEGPVYSHALAHIIRAKSNDNILKSKVDEIVNVEQNIRNLAAHQIVSVTDKWFVDKSGKSPEEIMNIIRYLLVQAGVGVKKEDWDTYDVMNDKIVRYLE